jgi:hypothetical protein
VCIYCLPLQKEDHILNEKATTIANLNRRPLSEAVTEPPFTLHLSGLQLLALVEDPLQVNLPVMSVAVERAVKEVTRAAMKCTSSKQRDGIVFQTLAARLKNPYEDRNRLPASGKL